MPIREMLAAIVTSGGILSAGILIQEAVIYAHDRRRRPRR